LVSSQLDPDHHSQRYEASPPKQIIAFSTPQSIRSLLEQSGTVPATTEVGLIQVWQAFPVQTNRTPRPSFQQNDDEQEPARGASTTSSPPAEAPEGIRRVGEEGAGAVAFLHQHPDGNDNGGGEGGGGAGAPPRRTKAATPRIRRRREPGHGRDRRAQAGTAQVWGLELRWKSDRFLNERRDICSSRTPVTISKEKNNFLIFGEGMDA